MRFARKCFAILCFSAIFAFALAPQTPACHVIQRKAEVNADITADRSFSLGLGPTRTTIAFDRGDVFAITENKLRDVKRERGYG